MGDRTLPMTAYMQTAFYSPDQNGRRAFKLIGIRPQQYNKYDPTNCGNLDPLSACEKLDARRTDPMQRER
ncbi:MAG: hypothetical protein Fur0046_16250 [Cyanobacteria bacterium J069]|nr:MAG: hypothetical protein D6742_03850 [Cyanobacteria bacterium J069]